MSSQIKLVTLHGSADVPSELPLEDAIISFGRSTNNILAINDSKVSRYHGEIALEDGVYVVRDLGSTNGVQVNGRRVESSPLNPGDELQIGDTRFRVAAPMNAPPRTDPEFAQAAQGGPSGLAQRPSAPAFAASGPKTPPQFAGSMPAPLASLRDREPVPGSPRAEAAFEPSRVAEAARSEPPPVVLAMPALDHAARRDSVSLVVPVTGFRSAAQAVGWESLRGWFSARMLAASPAGQRYALAAPRALTVVGPPGCGKTHLWRHLAAANELEALRVDLAALVLAPPDRWIDAVRAATEAVDAGPRRVIALDDLDSVLVRLGALSDAAKSAAAAVSELVARWLSVRDAAPLVVITASSPRHLHPALLRRGAAISEVFWLDLPAETERVGLLAALLERHGVTSRTIDVDTVARSTEGCSAAQLAFLVEDALFAALSAGRDAGTEHLLEACSGVPPLARWAGQELAELRGWAQLSARQASRGAAILSA